MIKIYLMNGKRRVINICQSPDVLPGFIPVLLFDKRGHIFTNQPVHLEQLSKTPSFDVGRLESGMT